MVTTLINCLCCLCEWFYLEIFFYLNFKIHLANSLFENREQYELSLCPHPWNELFFNTFQDSLKTFHELVKLHFKGFLKPPFNTEGRKSAGMTEEVNTFYFNLTYCNLKPMIVFDDLYLPFYLQWYVPLIKPSSTQKNTWLFLFKWKAASYSKKQTLIVEPVCIMTHSESTEITEWICERCFPQQPLFTVFLLSFMLHTVISELSWCAMGFWARWLTGGADGLFAVSVNGAVYTAQKKCLVWYILLSILS